MNQLSDYDLMDTGSDLAMELWLELSDIANTPYEEMLESKPYFDEPESLDDSEWVC